MLHIPLSLSAKEVKGMLDKSGAEIIGFTKMFPVEPALQNFSKFLTDSQKNIEAYYPQIDQLDFYRYFWRDHQYETNTTYTLQINSALTMFW